MQNIGVWYIGTKNLKYGQLHKPTKSSGTHGNANANLLRVGYHRQQFEFLWFSWPSMMAIKLFEVEFFNIKNSMDRW